MGTGREKFHADCRDCGQRRNCRDSWASWIFFFIGLVATIAVRVVPFLMHFDPFYAKLASYLGIIGFFVFFAYKFRVGHARSRVIEKNALIEKVAAGSRLSDEEARLVGEILCSLVSRKEHVNYLFIFGLSAVVLVIGVYMDFLR